MEEVIANISGKVRRATLNGREHLVAPLSLIVPGVLNGSQGPLFYPQDEVGKAPSLWNHIPIVVYHPLVNGRHVSARDPDVLNSQGVGVILRAKANGKLTAEGWFDVEATRRVDARVLSLLEGGKPVEVSTGLLTDNEPAEPGAEHNGVPYSFIARNYRPDHLAILPDQVGACSVDDGCGINVNAATKAEGGRPFPPRDFAYVPDINKPSTWKLRLTNVPGGSPDARIVGAAVAALGKGFRGNRVEIPPEALAGVIAKVRTAWLEANPGKGRSELPRIIANKEKDMNEIERKAIIDDLVVNCGCWEEGDREVLNEFNDDKLTKLKEHVVETGRQALVANAATKGFEDPQGTNHAYNQKTGKWESKAKGPEKKPEPTANKKPTEEEWLASAPASVREDLAFARNEKAKQKAAIVDRLVANVKDEQEQARLADRFSKKSLEDLQDMAVLVPEPKPVASYAGASTPGSAIRNVEQNFAPFGLPSEYIPEDK